MIIFQIEETSGEICKQEFYLEREKIEDWVKGASVRIGTAVGYLKNFKDVPVIIGKSDIDSDSNDDA